MTPQDAKNIAWLKRIARVPRAGTWPRLMTGPHPRAAGSYGPKFITWVGKSGPWPLWWWQQLAATRMLEHDRDGRLVWRVVCPTTGRQVGKSYLFGMYCLWRISFGAELFGEPQLIVHIAKDLTVAKLVQQPMRLYAREHPDEYQVRESGAETQIRHLASGSSWVLRSIDGPYGHSSSVGAVDEAWAIRPEVVDDALYPTQAQRSSPQLLLISTAHKKSTPLMISRRAGALAELDEPQSSTLWMEWSAGPDSSLEDPAAWRAASPQWDQNRELEIARAYATAMATKSSDPTEPDPLLSFSTQWLNKWPGEVEPRNQRGEPFLDLTLWKACAEEVAPPGPLVIAVEDWFGDGSAVALAGELEDGRVYIETTTFDKPEARTKAFDRAEELLDHYGCSRLLVGANLKDPRAEELNAEKAGGEETAIGLPLWRSLLADRRIVHDESDRLTEQLAQARVTRTASGALSFVPGTRTDAIRATAWCLVNLEQRPPVVPRIY